MANHPAEGNIVMLNIRIATPPWERSKVGLYECESRHLFFLIFSHANRETR